MKNSIKEIGIIPLILILVAIVVGSTSIYNCNDSCGEADASCEEGSDACCEGLDCVDGRCCAPTGDELVDGATEADCCSGRSKVRLSMEPVGSADVCCAGEGPTPGDNFSCCGGLTWHLGTCYACVPTGGEVPAVGVPCCDPTDTQVTRRHDDRYVTTCVDCPCGELPPDATHGTETRCRECPDAIQFDPDTPIPETCEPCVNPDDINCQQVIVMTKGYCDDPDAPGAECGLVTVRSDTRDDAEISGACLACNSDEFEFVTDESGDCDPASLNAILLEEAGISIRIISPQSPEVEQICRLYCGHDWDD